MPTLLTPRWMVLHVFSLVMVAACLGLTWWQFDRAQAGNARSLGYAFQWPAFAIFTIGVWAWLCRDATRTERQARPAPVPAPNRIPDEVVLPPLRAPRPVAVHDDDPELAAYNRMLARLAETDEP